MTGRKLTVVLESGEAEDAADESRRRAAPARISFIAALKERFDAEEVEAAE